MVSSWGLRIEIGGVNESAPRDNQPSKSNLRFFHIDYKHQTTTPTGKPHNHSEHDDDDDDPEGSMNYKTKNVRLKATDNAAATNARKDRRNRLCCLTTTASTTGNISLCPQKGRK